MPLLYHRVDVNYDYYNTEMHHLKALAVLFLSKPNIAAHVRHFSLRSGFGHGPSWSDDGDQDSDRNIDKALEKIKEKIASVSCDEEERATWLKEADYDDTFLALLLPTLVNMVSLDLMTPGYPTYTQKMLSRFATSGAHGSVFTKLKTLFWTYQYIRCVPTGAYISPGIFSMPCIERIYLHQSATVYAGLYGGKADERLTKFCHRTSTCTHLELRDCRFNPIDIQNLFLIPKALTTFIYEIGRQQCYHCKVSFSAIRQGLEHHKDTLEELCLDYSYMFKWEPHGLEDSSPMAPVDGFLRLKRLKIAPAYILGVNLQPDRTQEADLHLRILNFLPKSTQQLQLTHCEEPDNIQVLPMALMNIIVKKATHVPKLHLITLEIDSSLVGILSDVFRRILNTKEDIGTNIVLLNNFGCSEDKGRSKRVERKWGFDEDVEWKECHEFFNYRPTYEVIGVRH
jgi:hypothetical protein